MSIIRYFLMSIVSSLLLTSCGSSQKIITQKPQPEVVSEEIIEKETSFFSLPIAISLQEVENQVNKSMTGLLFNDDDLTKDQVKIKVWKDGDIKIVQEKNQVKIVFPIRSEGTYNYKLDNFGLKINGEKDFRLSGTFTFLSTVGLTNWQLKTKTTIHEVDWKEPPNIQLAGKKLSIEFLVNASLRMFKEDIEKLIDAALLENLNFKPQVLDALENIAKPVLLNEVYQTYFQMMPIELYATNATLAQNKVKIQMGLKCTMETKVGSPNKAVFDKKKVVLKTVEKMPSKIAANMVVVSTYDEASKIITQNFKGQKIGEGSKKIIIEEVQLWQQSGKLIVDLKVSGNLNGHLYLAGFPMYNAQTKEIFFDQLNYVLDTKNVLHRSANWLLKGTFLAAIRENCRYSIQKELLKSKDQLDFFLNNYQPQKGIQINGKTGEIAFKRITLTNTGLAAFLGVEGEAKIEINGLE
ncbi:MAG: DUF4403 family protein [Flavobacterium sp.]